MLCYVRIATFIFLVLELTPCVLTAATNIALNKRAWQISQTSTTHGDPGNAVDDDPNPKYHDGWTCTHTDTQTNPVWGIDLAQVYDIQTVEIINRDEFQDRLQNITVSVGSLGPLELPPGVLPQGDGYNVCAYRKEQVGDSVTFICNPGSVGRYFYVFLTTQVNVPLTLCELRAYGPGINFWPVTSLADTLGPILEPLDPSLSQYPPGSCWSAVGRTLTTETYITLQTLGLTTFPSLVNITLQNVAGCEPDNSAPLLVALMESPNTVIADVRVTVPVLKIRSCSYISGKVNGDVTRCVFNCENEPNEKISSSGVQGFALRLQTLKTLGVRYGICEMIK